MAGATQAALDRAQQRLGVHLPADHRAFMIEHDGFAGVLGEVYVCVYSLAELVDVNDTAKDLQRADCPGLVYFGSDGSREGFGWDFRQESPPVVMLEVTATGWDDALVQAPSFAAFLYQVEREGGFRWH